ncbi:MAG TPA: hypothetical protein PKD61_38565, partial [Polyangiaceae bacterium]|nr:hypothetical protein [Polyangiaceae bacterium]
CSCPEQPTTHSALRGHCRSARELRNLTEAVAAATVAAVAVAVSAGAAVPGAVAVVGCCAKRLR